MSLYHNTAESIFSFNFRLKCNSFYYLPSTSLNKTGGLSMNKKMISTLLLSSLLVLMTACSSDSSMKEDRVDFASGSDSGYEVGESAPEHSEDKGVANEDSKDISNEISNEISTNRMIIHEAKLEINVKNLDKAQLNIEKKVNEYGGYIVASNVYRENEERVSGNITVRVPEKHYRKFLSDAEEEAADILEANGDRTGCNRTIC